ncbi:MAG: hypothetical protein JW682_05870 [Campylobacterales bacterium]|jgi:hypothetical protein|nr:hypothetical protein [Campylobacterales bacterium]HEO98437.1 hypothetical protein [Campylobacterota bacterium]
MTEQISLLTLTRQHPLEDLVNAAAICIFFLLVRFSFFVASTKKENERPINTQNDFMLLVFSRRMMALSHQQRKKMNKTNVLLDGETI